VAPQTAVALRALKLGDLLVAVPALRALARGLPEHRLLLATTGWLAPVVELVPGVDGILPQQGVDHPLRVAPGSVDVLANLHGGPASLPIVAAAGAREVIDHGPAVGWVDGIHERVRWVRLVAAHGMPGDPDEVDLLHPGAGPVAAASVVHVGAFHGARWWPQERFAQVARVLPPPVVVTGSARERDRALAVAAAAGLPSSAVLAGRLDLRAFAALIADARIVVSADTGAAHLAAAYRRPCVVLFGPAPVGEWGPPASSPHVVLTHAHLRRGDAFADDPDPALLAVSVAEVLDAAAALLEGPRVTPARSDRS
jgi:ADP-heptose:LPS heptosyltransferase